LRIRLEAAVIVGEADLAGEENSVLVRAVR
jgi:hypothetical protein